MRILVVLAFCFCATPPAISQFGISSFGRSGVLGMSNTFANGVCTIERSDAVTGPWQAIRNLFTTFTVAETYLQNPNGFYRALALDLSNGRVGFTNLTRAYGILTTIAGAGGPQDINNWRPEFEGAPATQVLLSGPHIAMADRAGFIYIADKDAHG